MAVGERLEILYKQPKKGEDSSLPRLGVQNCFLKKTTVEQDSNDFTKKRHHHTEFEMHIVIAGCQEYEVSGEIYSLRKGNFLLISPNVHHTVVSSAVGTVKYSITFDRVSAGVPCCFFGSVTERILNNLIFTSQEAHMHKEISALLIENMVLDILVWSFRLMGIKENEIHTKQDKNIVVSLGKKYIEDNIETAPRVTDVAAYCHLSTKQLTRLFYKGEGISPGEYIIKQRIRKIEQMLTDQQFSLKEISRMMNFDNEYYFNFYFKKHAGMPPGEYRKMQGK